MSENDPALTLFMHPLASYCWKVLIALYENETRFACEFIDGLPAANEPFRSLWPIAKMPVLHDAMRDRIVPETSIIVEYLQDHYPGKTVLIPAEPNRRIETRLWDRFFDLYVQTPMQKLVSDRLRPEGRKDPVGVAEAKAILDTAYGMLERRMKAQPWVAGDDFTLADCAAMPALFYAEAVHPFGSSHPVLTGYFERLVARPSARRIIRAAQPYFPMFPFHEALNPRFKSPDF